MARQVRIIWTGIACAQLLFSVAGCHPGADDTDETEAVYSGYYLYGFEVMDFFPDGIDERWEMQGGPNEPLPCIKEAPRGSYPFVYMKLRGFTRTDRIRDDWNQRIYARDLYATEYISCRQATQAEHDEVMKKEYRRLCSRFPSSC